MAKFKIKNISFATLLYKLLILLVFNACVMFRSFIVYSSDTGLSGFNNQMFRPQVDGYGLYNVAGSVVLPHLKYSFGFNSNFNKNSLRAVVPARRSSVKLVDSNFSGDFSAALGFLKFMDIGVDIPVVFFQNGTNFITLGNYQTAALGDIRFDVKFRVLEDKPKALGIALLSSASFPTGSRYKFTGDKWPTWEGRLIIDKSFEPISLFANVGYRLMKPVTILTTTIDDKITFGGGLLFPIPAGNRSWALVAEVYGETVANNISKATTPVEVRGGVRKKFKSGITLNLGGGGGVTDGMSSPDFRVFAGISFNLADRVRKLKEVHVVDRTIYFDFGKYRASSRYYPELREIGQILAWSPEVKVDVEGYTDSTGHRIYNNKLSDKRAEDVEKLLVYFGADEKQIFRKAYGEEKPAASNDTLGGRKLNRRVEIRSAH